MKTQYNFKVESELKEELDRLQEESGVAGKEEFLQELLGGYKHCKANQVDTEIDLSKYDSVSKQSKTVICDAFKHILATIEANNTNNKQQALTLEQDKLSISDERKSFSEQTQILTAKHNQNILDTSDVHKQELLKKDDTIDTLNIKVKDILNSQDILNEQLENSKKELEQVQSIAEQVQSITITNKELRTELTQSTTSYNQQLLLIDKNNKEQEVRHNQQLEEKIYQIKELEQTSFKNQLLSLNKDKEIELLKEQLLELKNKENQIRILEKENIVLSTKLEILNK
ncbi:MAG: hypothetical protein KAJ49_00290 [Arcobacteraceae bacterium]|nr:hypothetical protein [Arcobacteraceae bacterium]